MANPFDKIPTVNEGELVCEVGDRFVVRVAATTEESEQIEGGAVYEVVGVLSKLARVIRLLSTRRSHRARKVLVWS